MLDAAARLREGQPVPAPLWTKMGMGRKESDSEAPLSLQRTLLAQVINRYLKAPKGFHLTITWAETKATNLILRSGIGFLSAVWVEIAQVLSQERGLFRCDECGRPYLRKGRRPKAGERNYCPMCGERGKASKRRSWTIHHEKWPSQRTHRGSIDNNFDNNQNVI